MKNIDRLLTECDTGRMRDILIAAMDNPKNKGLAMSAILADISDNALKDKKIYENRIAALRDDILVLEFDIKTAIDIMDEISEFQFEIMRDMGKHMGKAYREFLDEEYKGQ